MTNTSVLLLIAAVSIIAVLQILLLARKNGVDLSPLLHRFDELQKSSERVEAAVRGEIATNREEANRAAQAGRDELSNSLKRVADTLNNQIGTLTQSSDQKLDSLRNTIEERLTAIQRDNAEKLEKVRSDSTSAAQKARDEVNLALKSFNESSLDALKEFGSNQRLQLNGFSEQIGKLTESNQQKLEGLRATVESKLRAIQEDNSKQLELMRTTVDEKLQGTLEKRLGESFKLVNDRLEQVYKGLGEMQTLAVGVGDLKKVLTNVKTRGTWGEVQLGAMLEQILSPDQYVANVSTKGQNERVEFAIKLPGRGEDKIEVVWLPIDAKFPVEDYHRLIAAQENADIEATEQAGRQLEHRIKQCAKDICEKYINPPATTDFGILFLPTEGLFAEVIRRIGLPEYLQRECRVIVAGPTTLWSILNSLQMGFRTLAIQQRSSEVWKVLGAVKTEFGKFGGILDGLKKKLDSASSTIDTAAQRSRAIERKLRSVEELPGPDAEALLQLGSVEIDEPAEDIIEGK
jgi:DNA recombination protein RmuC